MESRDGRRVILIVEDDQDLRENLAELFATEGFGTMTAGTGQEAIERLAESRVDLILTDLRMPGKSGMELIEDALRLHPNVRAIVMTAFGDSFTEVESVRRGAIGYLRKPFEADEVLGLVARILSLPED